MRKFILLFSSILLFYSCLDDSESLATDVVFELIPIDEYIVPNSFTFGEKETIKLKYSLPNGCYYFDNIYEEQQANGNVIAIRAVIDYSSSICTTAIIQEEYDYEINIDQTEDYIFKFYKGTDTNGNIILEEVVVPVN